MSRSAVSPYESKCDKYLKFLVYAALKDWDEMRTDDGPSFDPKLIQSYDNLIRDKQSQYDGVKSRFTVSLEVKQYLSHIMTKIAEEALGASITDADTIQSISTRLDAALEYSYIAFVFKLGQQYASHLTPTLAAANEPDSWFFEKFKGILKNMGPLSINTVVAGIYSFMKALAYLYSAHVSEGLHSLSGAFMIATFKTHGINMVCLTEIMCCLREKKPSTRKKAITQSTTEPPAVVAQKAADEPLEAPIVAVEAPPADAFDDINALIDAL
jgi:hypothetical protein